MTASITSLLSLDAFVNKLKGFRLVLDGEEMACERSKRSGYRRLANRYNRFFAQSIQPGDGTGTGPRFTLLTPSTVDMTRVVVSRDLSRFFDSANKCGELVMRNHTTNTFLVFSDFVVLAIEMGHKYQLALVTKTTPAHLKANFARLDEIYAPANRYFDPAKESRTIEIAPNRGLAELDALVAAVALSNPSFPVSDHVAELITKTAKEHARIRYRRDDADIVYRTDNYRPSSNRDELLNRHLLKIFEPRGVIHAIPPHSSDAPPNRIRSYDISPIIHVVPLATNKRSAALRLDAARKLPALRHAASEKLKHFLAATGAHSSLIQSVDHDQ